MEAFEYCHSFFSRRLSFLAFSFLSLLDFLILSFLDIKSLELDLVLALDLRLVFSFEALLFLVFFKTSAEFLDLPYLLDLPDLERQCEDTFTPSLRLKPPTQLQSLAEEHADLDLPLQDAASEVILKSIKLIEISSTEKIFLIEVMVLMFSPVKTN